MTYKFLLLSDEVDNFAREIEINSDATFLELHEAILESVGYSKDMMTTFFMCSDNWEKEEEITLMEMDSSSEYDSYQMEKTQLDEFLEDEGQRLIYVFDMLTERAFFIELKNVIPSKTLAKAVCTYKKDNPPKQAIDFDAMEPAAAKGNFDASFYGDEEFDMDELDEDSFGDLSFDDLGNEY